jgi:hypothetical protein
MAKRIPALELAEKSVVTKIVFILIFNLTIKQKDPKEATTKVG